MPRRKSGAWLSAQRYKALPIDGALVLIRAAGNPWVAISELRQQFRKIEQDLFLDVKSLQSFNDDNLFLQRLAAGALHRIRSARSPSGFRGTVRRDGVLGVPAHQ